MLYFECDPLHNVLTISGDLTRDNANEFERNIATQPLFETEATLELFDLDIDDGVAASAAINGIRHVLNRVTQLTIVGAPQVLAHTLYRVGMLEGEGARVLLKDTREEEPYG